MCATADEDAGSSNGGAVAETPSEMDSSDTSESDKEELEAEAVITAPIIVGQKISLIDGHGKTWATTFVIDIEPAMPPDWHEDGKIGEYILVRGGVALPEATANGANPMSVASNWLSVKLFKKPPKRKKVTDYLKFPGILQHDWAFFDRNITPGSLMRTQEFLVDLQHVRKKIVKAKKETKASTEE